MAHQGTGWRNTSQGTVCPSNYELIEDRDALMDYSRRRPFAGIGGVEVQDKCSFGARSGKGQASDPVGRIELKRYVRSIRHRRDFNLDGVRLGRT